MKWIDEFIDDLMPGKIGWRSLSFWTGIIIMLILVESVVALVIITMSLIEILDKGG